jgi:hypothetical protein
MPVENEPDVSKWIWTDANATYVICSFDGKRFVPEVLEQPLSRGTNYYAVQTYSDLPGNRRVQVAWMNGGKYPGMPFNQQMSCPVEFSQNGLEMYASGGEAKVVSLDVYPMRTAWGTA